MAKIIELILVEERRKGKGVTEDPIRICSQLFTKEGALVAENDPYTEEKELLFENIK